VGKMFSFSKVVMEDFKNLSVIGLFVFVLHSNQWTRILAGISFLIYLGIYIYQHHKMITKARVIIRDRLDFSKVVGDAKVTDPIIFGDITPITRSRKKRRGSE
jgi:hypothetical protein